MSSRAFALSVALGVVAVSCASTDGDSTTAPATPTTLPTTGEPPIEDYPDAITRHLDRLARAPRPVARSAMPPRHLDEAVFVETLVDRTRIVSGGPPPDGIPPIDDPRFEVATEVDWLSPAEPVLAVVHDGVAKAYPIQIMIWHEIVNDEIAGTPIAITYCPLCNSGVVYRRSIGVGSTDVLDFGTSGGLFQANLVMYDRQSESLWTQFDGRAVIGDRIGTVLEQLPVSTIAWRDFLDAHPEGDVLSRDTANPRSYGRNPYNSYDQRDGPIPGFFTGDADSTLAAYERVVGVTINGGAYAIRTADVAQRDVVATSAGDVPLTIWHLDGTTSALNASQVAEGADIGATAVFRAELDGEPIQFAAVDGRFVDVGTQSTWNILGEAVDGPLVGVRLTPVQHVDTFWFSWATFRFDGTFLPLD